MNNFNLVKLLPFISLVLAQIKCPSGTPKSITIRSAWKYRWVACDNFVEGECPKNLSGPYSNPSNENCENYYSESGEDFAFNYYLCDKEIKLDDIKSTLESNGWVCSISD